jgi:hypothetical protein
VACLSKVSNLTTDTTDNIFYVYILLLEVGGLYNLWLSLLFSQHVI